MMRYTRLEHRFVEHVPENLTSGVLYISMEYATAIHRCCCGCGEEVVTPFTPTDWKMTFDGETVSLSPSIGNWNFACRSHYFIYNGRVVEAANWTDEQVKTERSRDKAVKALHYGKYGRSTSVKPNIDAPHQAKTTKIRSPLKQLQLLIQRCFRFVKQFF
ncbi:MAG: DUF6527 family protein [Leptolyngbya sp. BL-A-14]